MYTLLMAAFNRWSIKPTYCYISFLLRRSHDSLHSSLLVLQSYYNTTECDQLTFVVFLLFVICCTMNT